MTIKEAIQTLQDIAKASKDGENSPILMVVCDESFLWKTLKTSKNPTTPSEISKILEKLQGEAEDLVGEMLRDRTMDYLHFRDRPKEPEDW